MSLGTVVKKPGDSIDYDVDYSRWLPSGDRLTTATASIEGGTASITSTQVSETQVRVWLAGGTNGESATIKVVANTQQGRTKEICFRLRIKGC